MLSQESLYDSLALHLENYKKCYCHRGAVSFSGTCFELAVPVAHCVSVSKLLKSLSSKSQLPFHGGRTPSWLINKIKRKVALVCFGFFLPLGAGGEVCLLCFLGFFGNNTQCSVGVQDAFGASPPAPSLLLLTCAKAWRWNTAAVVFCHPKIRGGSGNTQALGNVWWYLRCAV